MAPLVVIISGPPCTGKSTLAVPLAAELGLPLISRDGLKEALFNRLGWRDRSWSRQVGAASYDLLFHVLERLLQAGCSVCVESNFSPRLDDGTFRRLQQRCGFRTVQVQCMTEGEELCRRFQRRSESGERHPGHVDHLNYEEMRPVLETGRYDPLDLEGDVLWVDTTDLTSVDPEAIAAQIRALGGATGASSSASVNATSYCP